MGDVPSTSQLLDARVQQFTDRAAQARVSLESAPLLLGPSSLQLPVPQALQQRNPAGKLGSSLVSIGEGLPAISERLFQRIGEGEYIDFSDVPPAKGKPRAQPAQLDGQPILILLQDTTGDTKKLLPDFPSWAQCFTVYTAAMALQHPQRVPNLMAYMFQMAKNARKFTWPSWVIYDQNFRQDKAAHQDWDWSKPDAGMFTQCFIHECRGCQPGRVV